MLSRSSGPQSSRSSGRAPSLPHNPDGGPCQQIIYTSRWAMVLARRIVMARPTSTWSAHSGSLLQAGSTGGWTSAGGPLSGELTRGASGSPSPGERGQLEHNQRCRPSRLDPSLAHPGYRRPASAQLSQGRPSPCAQSALAVALLLTAKRIDWRNRWSPEKRLFADPLSYTPRRDGHAGTSSKQRVEGGTLPGPSLYFFLFVAI